MASLPDDVIVLDAGSFEWRCGWSYDNGPSIIEPAGEADGVAALLRTLEGIDEVEECAILVAEPASQSAADRIRTARAIFAIPTVQSICFWPAPLLAIYNLTFDTGLLIDIGLHATFILALYEGKPVLEGPTLHPLGGRDLAGGGDAETLLEPNRAGGLCGVHEAILRTIACVDVSLRASLLSHIALVGGSTMAAGFPELLQQKLRSRLSATHTTGTVQHTCHVHANADRRLAAWLGAQAFLCLSTAQAHFYRRAEFEREPESLAERCVSLTCCTLPVLEAHNKLAR